MLVRLKVIRGKANRDVVDLSVPAVIGRSREADLTVIHPMISRRHCELFKRDGRIMVRDLGSLNGTYLGSLPIKESELHAGDTLAIGPLTFQVDFVSGVKGDPVKGQAEPSADPQSDLVVADSDTRGFPPPAADRDAAGGHKLETEPRPFESPESSAPTVPAESERPSGEPVADTDKVEQPPQGLFGDLPPPESFSPPPAESEHSGEGEAVSETPAPEEQKPRDTPPAPRGAAWADSPAPFTPIKRSSPVEPLGKPSSGEGEVGRPRAPGGDEFALHLPDRVISAEDLPSHPSSESSPISEQPSARPRSAGRGQGGWWPFGRR
ncbi:MAG: FHA domain-containing protein [Thermogutta sp.]|nr:FHA domain-containing protein [Thermogutta sp.]